MLILSWVIVVLYLAASGLVALYCLNQFYLLFWYKKGDNPALKNQPAMDDLPFVTIQLPLFNELYVAERLLDNILKIDYPKDLFEVQVLDDSTDETVHIVAQKVSAYRTAGFQIEHIHRADRTGFKAGALQNGMKTAKGEFIAIFDADFLPRPDFLRATLPFFKTPKVGVVQTRWEHLNEKFSLLTRLQAIQLNAHFSVEQAGRQRADQFLQFNGTAGVWRKTAIETAGGWQADTLTEDLDLSIRAQMKGWRIVYLEHIGSPAELPSEIGGLKSQQFRWMKGGAETARKMLLPVWQSKLPLRKKLQVTMHLLSSSIFIFVFVQSALSVPLIFLLRQVGLEPHFFSVFILGLFSIVAIYYVANVQTHFTEEPFLQKIARFALLLPLFLGLSMGMAFHNSIAVMQGWAGRKTAFVRTPKFNVLQGGVTFSGKKYLAGRLAYTTIFEGILAAYFASGLVAGILKNNPAFFGLHLLLTVGYSVLFCYGLRRLLLR